MALVAEPLERQSGILALLIGVVPEREGREQHDRKKKTKLGIKIND